ncbi:MAG: 3-deoxy-7-phosphoheptulonate synthase [Sodalis sp. (in: enterobacteria)]
MQNDALNNVDIKDAQLIFTPEELKYQFPLSETDQDAIGESRRTIANIIHGRDPHFLVICGPCSIHDTDAALDYARRLKDLSAELNNQLYIVMRVYFEKPRTIVGWKGLINDPYMDASFNIEAGLRIARSLLLKLVRMGLPLATEALDPNSPPYLGDLFSWAAIGARTSESQIHREMASGFSMPMGIKNGTDGSFVTAINAIHAAAFSHRFMGINQAGKICLIQTHGNPDCHLILRGGNRPNYYPQDVLDCAQQMAAAGLSAALMIDCSHGNSNKDYCRQAEVAQSVLAQIKAGNRSIIGLMLESHIHAGKQSAELPREEMCYGVSVSDACIDWKSTDSLLRQVYNELKTMRIS